ncbi:MAG: UDP-3-O-acyl-N-acetylglucosamine deacetylase [Bacteroidales bacterium]|nr:UDP-3-O-acyl-N-acetylglucosamine deacetylase [Bacteroidales bacterium]
MIVNQKTLSKTYVFRGHGLHTGKPVKMKVGPAPVDAGISFLRSDLGEDCRVKAFAENVTTTTRSTTISDYPYSVVTIEHIMSALTGLGIDNALVSLDNDEVPILDGSARLYAEAFAKDPLVDQGVPRHYITLPEAVELRDEKSGSWIRIEPSDRPSIDVTIDFNSHVVGVQSAHWDEEVDYAREIAPCRTFVFFHELQFLFKNNLIKGGDVDNAIVVVEHPVTDEQIGEIADAMGKHKLSVTPEGYLNTIRLHFPDEIGRHKLLDIIGDMRLVGGFLNAKVTAYKPGHTINTLAAKAVRKLLK